MFGVGGGGGREKEHPFRKAFKRGDPGRLGALERSDKWKTRVFLASLKEQHCASLLRQALAGGTTGPEAPPCALRGDGDSKVN